jgi:N-acetyl-1-D-myo-inositol-2-amino-2-deoxy-alpha-D-glucopyranoside deacetylase
MGNEAPRTNRDPLLDIRPGDRWMVVVAHPDDETFGCGSIIAHAAAKGAHVAVLCATRGEAGERTALIAPNADLASVRTDELRAAAALLGATRVDLLDYGDSGFDGETPPGSLCDTPPAEVTSAVAAKIAEIDPHVVAVLDGSDGHRDHRFIRCCTLDAVAAFATSAITVIETCLPNSLMQRWLDEMRGLHPDNVYQSIAPDEFGTPDHLITDVLDHRDVLDRREAAIALHRSQRSPFEDLSAALRREFLADTYVIRAGGSI